MPWLPSSSISNKTTFDSIRQGQQTNAAAQRQRASNPTIPPKFTQRISGESAQRTRQQNAQRMANPVMPRMSTQQVNQQRNQAAAQQRAQVRARIDQSRHG